MTIVQDQLIRVGIHPHAGFATMVRGKWRCTYCGHRLAVDGVMPIETRRMPPWTWHLELLDRRRAKMLPT